MRDEERTVYLDKNNVDKQKKNSENTVYINKEHSENGDSTVYIGKGKSDDVENTVYTEKAAGKETYETARIKTGESAAGTEENDVSALHYLPMNTMLQKRYRIHAVLGEGGFGITYSGWDILLNLPVAIKEYYPSGLVTRNVTFGKTTQVVPVSSAKYGTQFRDGIDRVLEEARRMAKFRNVQGIVGVYDFFEANSTAYIVMEYIDGCTFGEYCKNNRMDHITLFHMLVPVMDALQLLHNEGILHRDISPDNIMIDQDGNCKLLDFGAARGYLEESLTTMSVILKKDYAPEEQFRSKGIQGPWTDVYALGATIYELITGQTPPMSIDRLVEEEIVDIRKLAPSLTRGQAEAIMTALAVRGKNRWQSVDEFKNALLHSTGAVPVKRDEALPPEKMEEVKQSGHKPENRKSAVNRIFERRSVKYIGIGCALAVCVFLAAVFIKKTGDEEVGFLGVILSDVPSEITKQYDISDGTYVEGVYIDSPAEKGSLLPGDVIIALDSTEVSSLDDFEELIADYKPGDSVSIQYLQLRNGEYVERTKTVELAEKKETNSTTYISSVSFGKDSNTDSENEKNSKDALKEDKVSDDEERTDAEEKSNKTEETVKEDDAGQKTEMSSADDTDGTEEPVFHFDVPDYLDVEFVTWQNQYGYITFFFNVRNNSEESKYVDFKSYGFVQGIDIRSTSKGKKDITPGETTSIGCTFEWDLIGAVGLEEIDNVIFKMTVRENKDSKEYLDEFDQCIRINEEEDDWVACSFEEIDNSDVETTGTESYSFDQQNIRVRYAGYLNEYGYITYYFHVTNQGDSPLYCNFDNYQTVNGISIRTTTKGNHTILPGTTSAVGCTIDWDDVGNAGMESIENITFHMYVKEDEDSKERNEFDYGIIYSDNDYAADN